MSLEQLLRIVKQLKKMRSDITRLLVSKFPQIYSSHAWIEEVEEE